MLTLHVAQNMEGDLTVVLSPSLTTATFLS